MLNIGEIVFTSLVLLLSSGISAHIIHGFGSRKWKTTFIGITLLMMVCVQV